MGKWFFLRQAVRVKEAKGFSIIELMIVILIIGIMATISSYAYRRYTNNANLRTAARQLATDINTMKGVAVSQGMNLTTPVTISFNTTTNSYQLSTYPLSATKTRPAETKYLTSTYPGQSITIYSLPGGGTTYTLTFLTRGLLSPSPTAITNCDAATTYSCWIVLQNFRKSQATITFNIEGKTYVTFAMQ
jgi:prepilin-type N-terminal cleavage/methylation domain-containing protein